MIEQIIALLKIDNFYGVSENIDIAKGVNEIPKRSMEALKQGVRKIKSRKYVSLSV